MKITIRHWILISIVLMFPAIARAQYHVDEINPHALPTLRSIPTHVPGSSHNTYGSDTRTTEVEPTPVRVIPSPPYVYPNDTDIALENTYRAGDYGRDTGPRPASFGRVASPARQRALLAQANEERQDHLQGWQTPPPGTARNIKQARHAQIARRFAYNDRVKTRAEMELDYEQMNMWIALCSQPEMSPWHLLMQSATMYGYTGYGYGTENRVYPVYGLGGPGCVPMGGYGW